MARFAYRILRGPFPTVRHRVILRVRFHRANRVTANVAWPLIIRMRMIGIELVRSPELLLPLRWRVPVIKVHPMLLSFI